MPLWNRTPKPISVPASSPAKKPMMAISSALARPQWTPRRYDRLADEGYTKNVVAFRCVQDIAAGVASIPLYLFANEQIAPLSHPLLKLLTRPNPLHSGMELRQTLASQLLIAGNAYLERVGEGNTVELWPLRPDRMQVLAGAGGLPEGYEYRVGTQVKRWAASPLDGTSPILHLKQYHPLNDWYGFSPIEAASTAIDQHNTAGAWNQSLLQQGCRPSGALCVEYDKDSGGTLSEEQYSRLKEELDSQYSGAANAGRPILLEGGLKWVDMMLSPRDMDFLNIKNTAARDIALAFGYPPMLLGIPGDNTYSNQKEARLALWEQTILPLAYQMLESLNHWLAPRFGTGLRLAYDEDAVSALSPRREGIWDRVNAATFLSDAEKREALGYSGDR